MTDEGTVDPATGRVYVNGDGSVWVPQFDGQRPPFQPGNTMRLERPNLVSGINSPALVGELAAQIKAELRATAGLEHLRHPSFAGILDAYARAAAKVRLYEKWMSSQTWGELMAPRVTRSPAETLLKLQATADNTAQWCGLTPIVPKKVQAMIGRALRAMDRRTERQKLDADLHDALRQQMYPDEYPDHTDG